MAVFRNVMAFLGLDDDDQLYDDEAYYDDEQDLPPTRKRTTIPVDSRLNGTVDQSSFGFSADSEINELGGVGAVRPLRPVNADPATDVPDALLGTADRRVNLPETVGAFESDVAADAGPPDSALNERPLRIQPPLTEEVPEPTVLRPISDTAPVHDRVPEALSGGAVSSTAAPAVGAAALAHRQSSEENQSTVVKYAKVRAQIPSSFDDAKHVADTLLSGAPVALNLGKVDKTTTRRLIDFASGVCYALGAGMDRLAKDVFLLTPKGVDVSPEDKRRLQERGFNS